MIAHTKNINYEYVNQGAAVSRSVFNKNRPSISHDYVDKCLHAAYYPDYVYCVKYMNWARRKGVT